MAKGRISASVGAPAVDVFVDMGDPFWNRTVDGLLKLGTVSAGHAVAQETFNMLRKESVTKNDLEHMVKRVGKDSLHWGLIAGVYSGMEYGIERVRGRRDWKNAVLGGAVTGALVGLAENQNNREKLIRNAITGAAIATASEFLQYVN